MSDMVQAARFYKARGWQPLPLEPATKRPLGSEWQRTEVPESTYETVFVDKNLGINLGKPSGHIIDLDLDHELTVKMARHFIPKTPAIFGRNSKPASHYIYQSLDTEGFGHAQFKDEDGTMFAEVRGNGHQTMFPPSLHPSGELVTWHDPNAAPMVVETNDVIRAAGWLSVAAMLVRSWDSWQDQHHYIIGALAGGLLRSDQPVERVEGLIRVICLYTHDHEPDDRVRMVRDTAAKLEADPNTPVTGFPALAEYIGATRKNRIIDWLQLPRPSDAITCTDDGNANRLVALYGDKIRFCHEHNRWYIWDGNRWLKDERESIIGYAREIPRVITEDASKANDDEAAKVLTKWANASRSVNRIFAIPKIAKTDARVTVGSDQLDADPWLFNVQNGTIDLRTGGINPQDKSDNITRMSPITYNPRATCPRWLAYLEGVFAGNRELIDFIQRAVGYSLTGLTNEQAFFILYGPQGTGKTTFIETVRQIFGEYARNTDPSTLIQKQRTSRANPDVARLQGARFVSSSETEENDRLAAGLVKRLSGSTKITASYLYAEDFEFDPVMKLWIDTNHKPRISAHDDAVWARLVPIPFTVNFRGTANQIKGLDELLKGELPGILRWAVDGCLIWRQRGLERPTVVTQAADEYRAESDVISLFVDEACLVSPDATCSATDLFAAYTKWCNESNERPVNIRLFKTRLGEHGYEQKRTDSGQRWLGIRPHATNASDASAQPLGDNFSPFANRPQA